MKKMNELMQYVELLRELLGQGFKCEKELQEALKVLHKQMIPEAKQVSQFHNKKTFVIVIENDFKGVVKSVEAFTDLMGGNVQMSKTRGSDDHELRFGNTVVMIVKVNNYTTYLDRFRGLSPDYVINNANADLEKLGLRAK